MNDFIKQAMELVVGSDPRKPATKRPLQKLTDRQLIKTESEIGRKLFGPIPKGHQREFFCLNKDTWVWHEQWRDELNQPKNRTVRYEIRPTGIIKIEDGKSNSQKFLTGEELTNFALATKTYREKVARDLYEPLKKSLI